MKKNVYMTTLTLLIIFFTQATLANMPTITNSLVALQGYDAVSYFDGNPPTRGNGNYIYRYNDVPYIFTNEDNLKIFMDNPEKYMPQYGGYCAFAASKGVKAVADPLAWSVVDGKLYLNLSKQVQAIWEPNKFELIKEADSIWPQLMNQPF